MRYITQFNEYVFQRAVEDDTSAAFKDDLIEYTYTHGAYSPGKVLLENAKLSITLSVILAELPCEARPFYIDYIKGQLAKPGKLWAVENGTLMWAHAKIANVSPVKGTNDLDVEFALLEGVWHKADKQKTFLKPFDTCAFMDCNDFREIQPCQLHDNDCCKCGENHPLGCDCCDCLGLSEDMALCYHLDEVKDFKPCEPSFEAVFSCDGAERYFERIGTKMCGDCGIITGQLYSDTVLDSSAVTIAFSGETTNAYIEINGNGNQIAGTHKDLTVYPDGTITEGCTKCELGVGNWVVPDGNEYGWTIHQGNNRVVIDTGNCCAPVCVYISVDPVTY